MTILIRSLSEIAPAYRVLLCDLWGVVHNGLEIYPSAAKALKAFRATGGAVVLLTNAPRTHHAVARRLARMGLSQEAYDLIVTSGDATQQALLNGLAGRRIWHLGPGKDLDLFSELPEGLSGAQLPERVALADAEGILCTGPFDEFRDRVEDYEPAFADAVARNLPMLCANPDLWVDVGTRRIPCAGLLAQRYAEMGGRVMIFGKPHRPIYALARQRLAERGVSVEPAEVLVIGDGILTDLPGAAAEGYDAMFISGGLEARHFGEDPRNPDPKALAEFLAARGLAPRYAMGLLQ